MSANNERLEALVKYFDENPEIAEYLFKHFINKNN